MSVHPEGVGDATVAPDVGETELCCWLAKPITTSAHTTAAATQPHWIRGPTGGRGATTVADQADAAETGGAGAADGVAAAGRGTTTVATTVTVSSCPSARIWMVPG